MGYPLQRFRIRVPLPLRNVGPPIILFTFHSLRSIGHLRTYLTFLLPGLHTHHSVSPRARRTTSSISIIPRTETFGSLLMALLHSNAYPRFTHSSLRRVLAQIHSRGETCDIFGRTLLAIETSPDFERLCYTLFTPVAFYLSNFPLLWVRRNTQMSFHGIPR